MPTSPVAGKFRSFVHSVQDRVEQGVEKGRAYLDEQMAKRHTSAPNASSAKSGGVTGLATAPKTGCINILLTGCSGSGKSTVINTLVNFFRNPRMHREFPGPEDLLLAIPTRYLEATEPEGRFSSEQDAKSGKLAENIICFILGHHSSGSADSVALVSSYAQ